MHWKSCLEHVKTFDAYKQEIHDRKLDVRIADVDITDECLLAKFQNLNKYKKMILKWLFDRIVALWGLLFFGRYYL